MISTPILIGLQLGVRSSSLWVQPCSNLYKNQVADYFLDLFISLVGPTAVREHLWSVQQQQSASIVVDHFPLQVIFVPQLRYMQAYIKLHGTVNNFATNPIRNSSDGNHIKPRAIIRQVNNFFGFIRDVNKDLTSKDQDKDKDLKYVLKESL